MAIFTYTAVVDNLNDGSELASEGAAADQDQAANLDQLPRSELDIDIGHGEGFLYERNNSVAVSLFLYFTQEHSRSTGVDESGGLLSKEVSESTATLRNSDVPTEFLA